MGDLLAFLDSLELSGLLMLSLLDVFELFALANVALEWVFDKNFDFGRCVLFEALAEDVFAPYFGG